jgi:enterochelin esterase family protein
LLFVVTVAASAAALVHGRAPQAPNTDVHYQIGPDSLPKDGVPKGEVKGPYTLPSEAYPGTQHTYWVYVPAQYVPTVPASLMIFNDGQAFKYMDGDVRAPNVLDNLIYRREIPVMIGVFINPGRRPDQPEPIPSNWGDRDTNRPAEYNSLDDKYARVIVDELMPALYKEYNISKDPERHGIGGASSGAIAAFTVAWERPDHFRKVLSIVGSFVNLRGGDAYADIVRKSEKKPIRIFLQDGRNDNRGVGREGNYDQRRDWFYQNVRLMQALTEKGYEVNYSWGIGRHGQKQGGPMVPEMMRWLWRDHPASTDVNDAVERSFNEPVQRATPAVPQENPAVTELTRLESVWNDAHLKADAETLGALLADDAVITIPGMGAMSKEQSLGVLKQGVMKFTRYQTTEIRVRTYENAATVSGRLTRTRSVGQKSADDNWLFTKAYVRRAGKWVVVAFTASPAQEMPAK